MVWQFDSAPAHRNGMTLRGIPFFVPGDEKIQQIQHPASFRTEPAPVNLNLASLKGKACPSP